MSASLRWGDVARWGAREGNTANDRRKLAMSNLGAIIGLLSCTGFAVGLALVGPCLYRVALANLATAACNGVALVLLRRGIRTAAQMLVLLSTHALIVYGTMRTGLALGFQYYFFVFGALAFLNFGEQERWLRAAFASLSLGCCLYVCSHAPVEANLPGVKLSDLRVFNVISVVAVISTLAFIVQLFTSYTRRAEDRLAAENARSERLLLNVLPAAISARLKDDDHAIADGFAAVTVLFADLVGFTELSQQLTPAALVAMLNHVFSAFDDLAEKLGLEKIKTIGDCYMVVAGAPEGRPDHVEAAARMALGMREALARINETEGHSLRMRIGMHTGPVVAGVIGKRKFIYDVWGDTVNVASRMESSGVIDEIQVTRPVRDALEARFELAPRGVIAVKGRGELETFLLRGVR